MYIRSLIPADYEWSEYATRDDSGTGPWYIACADENKLTNEALDRLWNEFQNCDDTPYFGSGEEMDAFQCWLSENGYVIFSSAWGGIWHPEEA